MPSRKRIDLTGRKMGKLLVLQEFRVPYIGKMKNRRTIMKLECKCDCGRIFYPYKSNVLSGYTKGCLNCSHASNYVGKKIGKIEVLDRFWKWDKEKNRRIFYKIKCDCGNMFEMDSNTTRRLKGIRCAKCPKKPKPLLNRKQSAIINNYKKHERFKTLKIGQKSGYLTIKRFHGWKYTKDRRYSLYEFKCKCGNRIIRRGDIIGRVFSCGCFRIEQMPRGENNHQATLKNEEVYSIKELLKTKTYKNREIAKMFKVSEQTISHIKLGKIYNI